MPGGREVDRVKWMEHKGKRILYEDFSGLQDQKEIFQVTDFSTALICKQPESSVLLLTNVTGARYNPSIIRRLNDNSKLTVPYMKAYVVVGIKGLTMVILESFVAFTGLDIKLCSSVEEGLDWLAGQ